MKGLTRRQQEVLAFIEDYVRSRGFPPSVRDIAVQLSLVSASGVHKHIKALVRKNYLFKQEFTSRSLRVLRRTGSPRPAQSQQPEWPVTGALGGRKMRGKSRMQTTESRIPAFGVGRFGPGYALVVEDESYLEHGIRPGDTLLISKQIKPTPADLLLIEQDGLVALRNSTEASQLPNQFQHGVLVGLWRAYRANGEQAQLA